MPDIVKAALFVGAAWAASAVVRSIMDWPPARDEARCRGLRTAVRDHATKALYGALSKSCDAAGTVATLAAYGSLIMANYFDKVI